ncbi:MAG: hypothetical protein JNN30_16010 [Rhodanobacteraceae bacterium]|nr:hypothetical protein [Rhodanobacteraceae bacterium]
MESWVERLLQGIDLEAPDAALQVFLRIMGLVDWWLLLWLTLLCMAVGGLIGWRRGTFWRDVALAAALGPLGWGVSFLLPPPTRACRQCGWRNTLKVAACARCGGQLSVASGQGAAAPK